MLINRIINVDRDYGSGEVAEPVTVQQAKDYLRLSGFSSDDDSSGDVFDFDDVLLQQMIEEGRAYVEQTTGQIIIPSSLSVVLLNQAGGIELPGPVNGDVAFSGSSGDITDSLEVVGTLFPKIITEWNAGCEVSVRGPSVVDDKITATYQAGYDTVPAWVKNAILAYVAWAYENRGDENIGSPQRAAAICRPHDKRQKWG